MSKGNTSIRSFGTMPLPDIIAPGSVGDATHIPVLTYDAKGRLTVVTTAAISSGTQRTFAFFAA